MAKTLSILFLFLISLILYRLSRRSGVTNGDISKKLASDELFPDADFIIDRATVVNATPEEIWPWIVQLGKKRGGWYMPHWLEAVVVWKRSAKSLKAINPDLQKLKKGDQIPDYGPGVFEVITIDKPKILSYGFIPRRSKTGKCSLTWTFSLSRQDNAKTKLHLRLRGKPTSNTVVKFLVRLLGGLVDYLTIIVMFAGLKQNLKKYAGTAKHSLPH